MIDNDTLYVHGLHLIGQLHRFASEKLPLELDLIFARRAAEEGQIDKLNTVVGHLRQMLLSQLQADEPAARAEAEAVRESIRRQEERLKEIREEYVVEGWMSTSEYTRLSNLGEYKLESLRASEAFKRLKHIAELLEWVQSKESREPPKNTSRHR